MERSVQQRRHLRMRRSTILEGIFGDLQQNMAVKKAETQQELNAAFALVHEEYLRAGYITEPNRHRIFFNIHSILPGSCTLLIKNDFDVAGTLSMVVDSDNFGLPMDSIYQQEVSTLRAKERRVCEFCSLALSRNSRLGNLMMPLLRAMLWHAIANQVDDICIMVNPKHVSFYKVVLLFEDLGPERFYPRVEAPAVALRIDLREYKEDLRRAYEAIEPQHNLYEYFYGDYPTAQKYRKAILSNQKVQFPTGDMMRYFLAKDQNILKSLGPGQLSYLTQKYPNLI